MRFPPSPIGAHQSDWSQQRPVTYAGMIRAMNAAGVAKAAVVQASSVYAHKNSYVAAAVAAHPTRFTGVFSVDLIAPDAVEKMKQWMSKGLSGMRLYTAGTSLPVHTVWFADEKTFPAWSFAGEAGLPVCMQMRAKGLPPARVHAAALSQGALHHRSPGTYRNGRWPILRSRGTAVPARAYPNLYLKVTHRNFEEAGNGRASPDTFFARLVKDFGANRIAWGSNFPAARQTLPELVALARASLGFLSQQDRDWISRRLR